MKRRNMRYRSAVVLASLLLILALAFFVAVWSGYTVMTAGDLLRIFLGGGSSKENLILFEFRMPRIVLGMLAGMGFALAGMVMQTLTRNALAEPGILGINAGAGLVVVVFLTLAGTLDMGAVMSLPFLALLGALLAGGLIYAFSVRKGQGLDPGKMVLNGIALQLGLNAATTFLALSLDADQYKFVASFQAGSIWNTEWPMVTSLLPWILAGFVLLMLRANVMNIFASGDEVSIGLGIHLRREKLLMLLTALAVSAACVSAVGSMSFVGLVAPHLARRLVGRRHQNLIPCSMLTGGILVVVSDTIARTVFQPTMLPTGLVTSMVGAPYFIILLLTQRKKELA